MLEKIKEYYLKNGFKETPEEYLSVQISNNIEKNKSISDLEEEIFLHFLDLKIYGRLVLENKNIHQYNTFIHLEFDINIPDNFQEMPKTKEDENFLRYVNPDKEKQKEYIIRRHLDYLKNIFIYHLNRVKQEHLNNARRSNNRLFILIKDNNFITQKWINELEENTSYTQVSIISYENKNDIIDYFENIDYKSLNNLKESEYDLYFKLPIIQPLKQDLSYYLVDLKEKDKEYMINKQDISNTFNENKTLCNYFLKSFNINEIEDLDIILEGEMINIKDIYLNKKSAFSILVLLTTILNDNYDNIILDFLPIEEYNIKLMIFLTLLNKHMIIFSYFSQSNSYLLYKLNKIGYKMTMF